MDSTEKDQTHIQQKKLISFVENTLGDELWTSAYFKNQNNEQCICFYTALVPNDKVKKSLSDFSWDIDVGSGLPGCCIHYEDGKEHIRYFHNGDNEQTIPLVLYRHFHGIKPPYFEILEEFRLFHNLYYDPINNKYLKICDDGEEEEIIIVKELDIKIKMKAIKQFLAVKEMSLAILFDCRAYSKKGIKELKLKKKVSTKIQDNFIYNFAIVGDRHSLDGNKTFSRLLGKKIVSGFPKEKSGIWPYNEDKKREYAEFIIGVDEYEEEILHTCDPYGVNNMGNNPAASHYLTPIFFKKEVLNKYYSNPDKYSVDDGMVSCGNLWGLYIDNNHKKYVTVFLGDLGKTLSYNEQLYWKSYNVPPEGGISEVCFNRSFMALATNPEKEDLKFKQTFEIFQENWNKKYGWYLFNPLPEEDIYHIKTLRIPLNDSQNEFDEQVRGLVKILIDSINEKEINKSIGIDLKGGITKLEKFLENKLASNYETHIKFLRNLQNLRSASVAHIKGSNYKKIAKVFDIGTKSPQDVFKEILNNSISFIECITVQMLT